MESQCSVSFAKGFFSLSLSLDVAAFTLIKKPSAVIVIGMPELSFFGRSVKKESCVQIQVKPEMRKRERQNFTVISHEFLTFLKEDFSRKKRKKEKLNILKVGEGSLKEFPR